MEAPVCAEAIVAAMFASARQNKAEVMKACVHERTVTEAMLTSVVKAVLAEMKALASAGWSLQ